MPARLGRASPEPARTGLVFRILHSEPWHTELASCPAAARTAPASTTDASGAPFVRQDGTSTAKVRIIVENKS